MRPSLQDWRDQRVIHGAGGLDPIFSRVGEAFAENFDAGAELGASFAVVIDDVVVVDLRGGVASKAGDQPWAEDTIACIYSSGKAVLAMLVALEASAGRINYDAPVAEYWPAFGVEGKEEITIAQVMSHQAGLPGFEDTTPPQTHVDWGAATAAVAAMAPLWPPGSVNGYHPQTVGYIIGEVLRRISGVSVGGRLRALKAQEDLSVFCGLRDEEIARAAFMQKPPRPPDLGEINEATRRAFLARSAAAARVDRETWMRAEIPASNMHADAVSLARLLRPMAQGGVAAQTQLIASNILETAFAERICGDDLVLPFRLSWAAGLMRNINRHFGPNESALGHAGFGGSAVVIDPENRMTIAYVMNKMSPYLVGDPRSLRLIDAVYDAL
ncbi:MAG: serine hydrolase domain-containing protein [Pseudomonadota bacterium]